MPNKKTIPVQTTTQVSTSQKIALLYVVSVGVIVLGSVLFSAIYTWTGGKQDTIPTASATKTYRNGEVLGVDQVFVTSEE
ncbi:MAG: hypothetical protein H6760_02455 [Candidatus Nomurabacteria bacterium]|nr:MAG: hypothetical protein H6760_02455 [Candidatus Nomurabacteria bacterium]